MQFSSRPPFSDDPTPWRNEAWKGTPFHRYSERTQSDDEHDPRPEYDRPQHNPTNPILVYARRYPDSNILWSYLPFRPTDDMIAHARKVLNRRRDLRIAAEVEALFPKESA